MKILVHTTVNGDDLVFSCEPRQSLLEVLRDELGLLGSKEGCNDGNCGACSVIVDGQVVCSCLVLGAEAEGRTIDTVEGMSDGTLYIIGTDGRDHVDLKFKSRKDELKVDIKLDQKGSDGGSDNRSDGGRDRIRRTFTASSIERIVTYLCGGDDHYNGGSDAGSDGGPR